MVRAQRHRLHVVFNHHTSRVELVFETHYLREVVVVETGHGFSYPHLRHTARSVLHAVIAQVEAQGLEDLSHQLRDTLLLHFGRGFVVSVEVDRAFNVVQCQVRFDLMTQCSVFLSTHTHITFGLCKIVKTGRMIAGPSRCFRIYLASVYAPEVPAATLAALRTSQIRT
ncbi:hypothetical protein D3C76_1297900 [compost metagenome]